MNEILLEIKHVDKIPRLKKKSLVWKGKSLGPISRFHDFF